MTAEANPQPNAPPSPGGSDAGPWHDGERAIHRRLGLDETIDPIGRRNIRPFMPDQHRLYRFDCLHRPRDCRRRWPVGWETPIHRPPSSTQADGEET
jgi:hypothetical protein